MDFDSYPDGVKRVFMGAYLAQTQCTYRVGKVGAIPVLVEDNGALGFMTDTVDSVTSTGGQAGNVRIHFMEGLA